VKRRDLERHLTAHGARRVAQGGKHTKWRSADGTRRDGRSPPQRDRAWTRASDLLTAWHSVPTPAVVATRSDELRSGWSDASSLSRTSSLDSTQGTYASSMQISLSMGRRSGGSGRQQRQAARKRGALAPRDVQVADRIVRLAYTRKQAAEALGVRLATSDRRVVPAITTVDTEWGAWLIPIAELERTSPSGGGSAGQASSLAPWSQASPTARSDRSYPQRACKGRESWRDRARAEPRRGPDVAGGSPVVALDGACRPRTFESPTPS
jgi:hypothetical protein